MDQSISTHRTPHKRPSLSGLCLVIGCLSALFFCLAGVVHGQPALQTEIDARAAASSEHVTAWRRDIHEHPELSNREF